ncbi:MAG: hypothetical protein ABFD70_06745 [Syntrophaceae bacterium]|nr:hypothetical protein [Deltaproteobacteria bacterium]
MGTIFLLKRLFIVSTGILLLLLGASCGGGGGGGGDGDGGGVEPRSVYNFTLGFLDDPDNQFVVSTAMGEAAISGAVSGTYATEPASITLNSGPAVRIETGLWEGSLGILSINLNTDIESIDGDNPDQGTMVVYVGEVPDFDYNILVTITDAGVELRYNGGDPPSIYSWDEFLALLENDEAEEWEKQASFAVSVLSFVTSQVSFVAEFLIIIEDDANEASLEGAGHITIAGDPFPPIIEAAGNQTFGWEDSSANGDLGPGDDFTWTFTDYGKDSSDDIDQIADGTVELLSFTENETPFRLGFEPYGGPGGVFFHDFSLYEVEEGPPGVFTPDIGTEITINGGYTIIFTEP